MKIQKAFSPQFLDKTPRKLIVLFTLAQALALVIYSQFFTSEVMPKPFGIFSSAWKSVTSPTFGEDFVATLYLIAVGMFFSIIASLFFVYLSLVPFFSNVGNFVSKLRFLTYTGLIFVFTMLVKNGHDIKLSLLVFGIVPYFVTSLLSYINDIPREEYELCYSLKMSKWKTLYEVVVRGKMHLVIEVIRQNFAIAWMMITSVEGIAMSEGGLGTMMIKSNKYMKLDEVFGVLLVILIIGILFDYFFDVLKVWLFPYTDTKRYKTLWLNRAISKFSKQS